MCKFFLSFLIILVRINTYSWKFLAQVQRMLRIRSKDIPCLRYLMKKCSCSSKDDGHADTWPKCECESRAITETDWWYIAYTVVLSLILIAYACWLFCMYLLGLDLILSNRAWNGMSRTPRFQSPGWWRIPHDSCRNKLHGTNSIVLFPIMYVSLA